MMSRVTIPKNILKFYGRSVVSLSFNLGGLAAGFLVAASVSVILNVSWALLLYPSVLSVKGAIGGLLSGRLSTALHLGTIKPSLTGNTRHFRVLINSILTLTLVSSFVMWTFACIFGFFIIGITVIDWFVMLIVILSTMGLSFVIVSPLTAIVSAYSLRKGLDPDITTYPIISTIADILVTAIYLLIVVAYKSEVFIVLVVIAALFVLVALRTSWISRREEVLRKTLREFIGVLFIIGFFVNIAGSLLERISHVIETQPYIYMIYPACIDTVGDVGSIVGSTATTKLNLGQMERSLSSFRNQSTEIIGSWSASLTLFISYAIIALLSFWSVGSISIIRIVLIMVLTNLLAVGFAVIVSILLAIGTYMKGWDPDNFVIPIESTLSDAATSLSLLAAIIYII